MYISLERSYNMGYSSYSHINYTSASTKMKNLDRRQIFTSTSVPQTMDIKNLSVRECRDSEAHPEALPIIIGLDVTGSMGYIPEKLIKGGLGTIMHTIITTKIADPAVCFVAIGDQFSDQAPLQAGQFESGDQELIKWLREAWLEGGGGGSSEESYQMAWYFALNHVETDHWEKRKKKGIIITIGDEAVHSTLKNVAEAFGKSQAETMTTKELLEKVSEKWDVYHIHANDGSYPVHSSTGKRIVNSWKDLLGQKVYVVDNHTDIPKKIAEIIKEHELGFIEAEKQRVEEEIKGKSDTDISGVKKKML